MQQTDEVIESILGVDVGSADFPLESGKIRELAFAIGEDDPVFTDPEAARAAGYRAPPGPLTWPVLAGHWRDGDEMIRRLRVDPGRLLHGEISWEYLRPVTAGMKLHADRQVVDATFKTGNRGGEMRLITVATTYTDGDGAEVARQTDVYIERGA